MSCSTIRVAENARVLAIVGQAGHTSRIDGRSVKIDSNDDEVGSDRM